MKNPVLIFGLVFIVAIGAYLVFNRAQPQNPQALNVEPLSMPVSTTVPKPEIKALQRTPQVVAQADSQESPVIEPLENPIEVERAAQLDGSDEAVKEVMSVLNPSLLSWFNQDELLRKLVMAVDRVASGEIPSNHLPLSYRKAMFKANEINHSTAEGEPLFNVALENYERFSPLISALHVIDPQTLAAYYQDWLPLLEQAYAELGMESTFDQRFHLAIDEVLSVRDLASDTPLTQPHVFYEYQDPEFENANAVHKFIWRIGPNNSRSLQNYLRALKREL